MLNLILSCDAEPVEHMLNGFTKSLQIIVAAITIEN